MFGRQKGHGGKSLRQGVETMALNDIETFVIVILENRSFDHAVGYLSLPDANPPMAIDGLSSEPAWLQDRANKDKKGNPIAPFALAANLQTIIDPPHDLPHIDTQINRAPQSAALTQMGGFVKSYEKTNPKNPQLVMGYYKADAVPALDFFARNFAICDNWFSSLPSGTQPNRLMAMAGESRIKDNATLSLPHQPLVYDWLTQNDISWCSYQWAGFPFFTLMLNWALTILASLDDSSNLGSFRRYEGFHDQWNGDAPMPNVIFIEPKYTDDKISSAAPNDDHPPTGVLPGEDFLRRVYRTLISNPDRWKKTAMIVAFDEHGGFFDHVPPLKIKDKAGPKQVDTTGVRVPAFIVSPHVAAGKPFKNKLDHTSILRLLADRFTPGRPYSAAVTARQRQLDPLSAVFVTPPPQVAAPEFPEGIGAAMHVLAAAAPVAPAGPGAPLDTETAQAFDRVARELAATRPDLLTTPHGQLIADYVAGTAPTGAALAASAPVSRRAAAQPGRKTKPKAASTTKGSARGKARKPTKAKARTLPRSRGGS
jgi:phospholipase C